MPHVLDEDSQEAAGSATVSLAGGITYEAAV